MALKKKNVIGIVAVVVIIIAAVLLGKDEITGSKHFTVKKGKFESSITVKGEIQGKNEVKISLSEGFKNNDLRIRELQIKDLIQEGTLVKKGDWVATLDIANITQQIQENKDELEERLADFENAKIDSAIELTNYREEIKEFRFDLEYKKLELEQAKFESSAYQRKVNVAYNKTLRTMDQKLRNYERKKMEIKVRMERSEGTYNYFWRRDSLLKKAVVDATILAPQDGMVMYARERHGRKIRVGDQVSPWSPVIATLPDMSVLVSETYVEEIEITKITIGDSVDVVVDALPNQIFSGYVAKIANIGQELSGFESKVFWVSIELKDHSTKLKPAMTTNNTIIINSISNVLTIPRECLFSENDTNFVYLRKSGKVWKQAVTSGLENEKEIIIQSGLEEGDKILFSAPDQPEKILFYENLAAK